MAIRESGRESWATRTGFVLAAVGSAVGLGNVWRFPFVVGESGGAAFLLVYLLFIILIGLAAILVEFVIGRNTDLNPVGAIREFGGPAWRYVGLLFVFTGIILLSFYSVAAGWAVRYTIGSLTGGYLDDPGTYFGLISMGWDAVVFHFLFMVIVVGIVALGVQRGIEIAVKLMVPSIIVLMIGLAIYAATLPDAGDGYVFYLSPDLDVLLADWQTILPDAAGQAFFTLSLGMGVMITYASYLAEDRNLGEDGAIIVGLDTGIAVAVGLIVFPILAAAAVEFDEPGPGAVFVSLSQAFGDITGGLALGFVFFLVLTIAALSSAISLIEVVVSYLIDEWGIDRPVAAVGIGNVIFLVGIPTALDTDILTIYDAFAANILLPLGGIILVILVGWVQSDKALAELERGTTNLGRWGPLWLWIVRVPVLVVLIVAFILAVQGFANELQLFLDG